MGEWDSPTDIECPKSTLEPTTTRIISEIQQNLCPLWDTDLRQPPFGSEINKPLDRPAS